MLWVSGLTPICSWRKPLHLSWQSHNSMNIAEYNCESFLYSPVVFSSILGCWTTLWFPAIQEEEVMDSLSWLGPHVKPDIGWPFTAHPEGRTDFKLKMLWLVLVSRFLFLQISEYFPVPKRLECRGECCMQAPVLYVQWAVWMLSLVMGLHCQILESHPLS